MISICKKSDILLESRTLLREAALSVVGKFEILLEKEPLNSLIPQQLAIAYRILGQFERSREMSELSQRIEGRLMCGDFRPRRNEEGIHRSSDLDYITLPKEFVGGLFSGLMHPIAYLRHIEDLRNAMQNKKFSHRFVNVFGRFCGGFPSAFGLVYCISRFHNDPRIVLPLGLSLIVTNSVSYYRIVCSSIKCKFENFDDDTLVGFYKAFKGNLRGAYEIFRAKNDLSRACMIGDFYLEEAEMNMRLLEKEGLINLNIMNLLTKKSLEIYKKMHDPTNLTRIASDYSNEGFFESSSELWEKYYALKNQVKKDNKKISSREKNNGTPTFHLSKEDRDILVKECEEICRSRYKNHSVNLPYTPRMETGLYRALYLLDSLKGYKDFAYYMTKARIYRLLDFKKSAEKCESIINLMERDKITLEEKAKVLKKMKELHFHANPLDKIKSLESMKIKSSLTDEALEYLSR